MLPGAKATSRWWQVVCDKRPNPHPPAASTPAGQTAQGLVLSLGPAQREVVRARIGLGRHASRHDVAAESATIGSQLRSALIGSLSAKHAQDLRSFFRIAGLTADDQLIGHRDELNHAVGKQLVDLSLQVAIFDVGSLVKPVVPFNAHVVPQNLAPPACEPQGQGCLTGLAADQLELRRAELDNFQDLWIGNGEPRDGLFSADQFRAARIDSERRLRLDHVGNQVAQLAFCRRRRHKVIKTRPRSAAAGSAAGHRIWRCLSCCYTSRPGCQTERQCSRTNAGFAIARIQCDGKSAEIMGRFACRADAAEHM